MISTTKKSLSPLSILALLFFTTLFFSLLGRVAFLFQFKESIPAIEIARGLLRGTIFDAVVALYLFIPFALAGFLPRKTWEKRWFQRFCFGLYFFEVFLLAFNMISEIVFVDEFQSRFNFIAVDYLVYTNEVIKNIWQSYPIVWVSLAVVLAAFFLARFAFKKMPSLCPGKRKIQLLASIGAILLLVGSIYGPDEEALLSYARPNEAEVAKNAFHALFSAYRHNEINFDRFYAMMDPAQAVKNVHDIMASEYPRLGENEDSSTIVRNIVRTAGPEKKLNVVIVLMESMSARFMKAYGAEKILTPNLDSMAKEGLFFDRLYATGTRTVRGIEATVLSLPPTPGQSIVRRPAGTNLFNIGTVMKKRGYRTRFIYGGNSYFDNMGGFFQNNGFEILDKSNLKASQIRFATAWGVCDQDLFDFALRDADEITKDKTPFFQYILTTSNHRPYKFPEGIKGLPAPAGRDEAVLYSDYSIGEYIAAARQKPWFKDTVFIFVADHNASVAGGTKVLPADYRIPLIFYSPANIKPQKNSVLSSQIDLAPTLFGLLNFSYQSRFFGHDLLRAPKERAFLGTYQRVGLWQHDKLVLLSPNRKVEENSVVNEIPKAVREFTASPAQTFADQDIVDTISYFQTASFYFRDKLFKEDVVSDEHINIRNY